MKQTATKQSKHRRATAAVMALALGAAVYLNWSFARQAPEDLTASPAEETAVETAAAAITDPLETSADAGEVSEQTVNKNYGEAQMVSVTQDAGTNSLRRHGCPAAKRGTKRWRH